MSDHIYVRIAPKSKKNAAHVYAQPKGCAKIIYHTDKFAKVVEDDTITKLIAEGTLEKVSEAEVEKILSEKDKETKAVAENANEGGEELTGNPTGKGGKGSKKPEGE